MEVAARWKRASDRDVVVVVHWAIAWGGARRNKSRTTATTEEARRAKMHIVLHLLLFLCVASC
jgi:hypothetical protein